jgi:hypothetical protein
VDGQSWHVWDACIRDGNKAMMEVAVLRYTVMSVSPGCLTLVLESLSDRPPYVLDNRSSHPMLYHQATSPALPYFVLPPYAAAGFVWQFGDGPHKVHLLQSRKATCGARLGFRV